MPDEAYVRRIRSLNWPDLTEQEIMDEFDIEPADPRPQPDAPCPAKRRSGSMVLTCSIAGPHERHSWQPMTVPDSSATPPRLNPTRPQPDAAPGETNVRDRDGVHILGKPHSNRPWEKHTLCGHDLNAPHNADHRITSAPVDCFVCLYVAGRSQPPAPPSAPASGGVPRGPYEGDYPGAQYANGIWQKGYTAGLDAAQRQHAAEVADWKEREAVYLAEIDALRCTTCKRTHAETDAALEAAQQEGALLRANVEALHRIVDEHHTRGQLCPVCSLVAPQPPAGEGA